MSNAHRLLLVLTAASLLVAGFAPAEGDDKPAKTELSPLVSLRGAHSKIAERAYHQVTSAEDFQALYMRHLGHDPADFNEHYNPHGVPAIDFDRCLVVAIFQGEHWNSAGVYVHSVIEEESRVLVRFDDRSYQTEGGGRRVTAYGFFVLPRSAKELVLEENVQQILGEPPEWKERAHFAALASQ